MELLEAKLQALLFVRNEGLTKSTAAKFLQVSKSNLEEIIKGLSASMTGQGIVLIENEDKIILTTALEHASFLDSIIKKEVMGELTKATLETLTIATYGGGVTKAEIDYIRGVNSQVMLRTLIMRGMVEKRVKGGDSYYYPTLDTLRYLGVANEKILEEGAGLKKIIDNMRT